MENDVLVFLNFISFDSMFVGRILAATYLTKSFNDLFYLITYGNIQQSTKNNKLRNGSEVLYRTPDLEVLHDEKFGEPN